MLFNSFQFLIFFPLVTIIYFLLPHKYRWFQLLVASCIFYMVFIPVYILILFLTICIDYVAGIAIENAVGRRRKFLLAISIVTNVGILAVFKYYNFFAENLNEVFHNIPLLTIALPIGLSFHTFQAMSYTIEVYRGNHRSERHFGIYALYVMFFPQLVAGPIERPQNVLHQFHEKKTFDYANLTSGLKLILWGLFKKVVIADRISLATNEVFNDPGHQSALSLIIGTVFFSFQIYCDFSGYSDIALGTARVLGFKLMKNFDAPYQAKNISEFWQRWHISLSTWFRDYLYISIGGNRVSVPRWYFNLFFVFLVSGFWHGANWTFLIWGALHGFYLIFAYATSKWRTGFMNITGMSKMKWLFNPLQVIITFILVSFAWIFFRANSLRDAWTIVRKIITMDGMTLGKADVHGLPDSYLGLPRWYFGSIILLIIFLLVADFLITRKYVPRLMSVPLVKYLTYFLLVFAIIFLGVYHNNRFIYFQF